MKRTTPLRNLKPQTLLFAGLSAFLFAPVTLKAQAEVQPDGEEEQWYDPADWFDDGDLPDGGAYYPYSGPYWADDYWSDELDYDYLDGGYNYGIHYEWDPDSGEWKQEYGYYEDAYSYKLEWDDDDLKPADGASSSTRNQTTDTQSSGRSANAASQPNQSSSNGSSSENSVKTLTGTIDGFRKLDLQYTSGLTANHTLARVSLQDGSEAVIDLGYSSLVTPDLKKGDEIKIKGNRGQINGQNVFVATELKVHGDTHYIDRAIALEGGAAADSASSSSSGTADGSGPSAADLVTMEGTLEDHAAVDLGGDSGDNTLVKLRLESGQAATIDLGPNTSLSDLQLEQGDQIRIRGRKTKIENRSVITAQSISVEGESVKG